MKVSFFETGRYVSPPDLPREWPVPPAPTIPRPAPRRCAAWSSAWLRRGARLRLGQRLRAPLLAAHPDAVADRLRRLARRARGHDQDRAARPDRAAQQSGPRGRGAGDARHAGAGAHRRRPAARHHQRVRSPTTSTRGGARADRRGDGADPARRGPSRSRSAGRAATSSTAPSRSGRARSSRSRRPTRWAPARESCEFAARHRLGLGVSYGPFEVMAKATRYYREQCAHYGWEPGPDHIIYRANMILGETDDAADDALRAARRAGAVPGARRRARRAAGRGLARNVAGERRAQPVGGVLPTSFCGSPDRVVEQIRRCREQVGAGVLDLSLHRPGTGDTGGDACARSICSAARSCRASARSERRGVQRRPRRGGRLPHPLPGGGRGHAAGASARRRRHAPDAGARPAEPASPGDRVRDAWLRPVAREHPDTRR